MQQTRVYWFNTRATFPPRQPSGGHSVQSNECVDFDTFLSMLRPGRTRSTDLFDILESYHQSWVRWDQWYDLDLVQNSSLHRAEKSKLCQPLKQHKHELAHSSVLILICQGCDYDHTYRIFYFLRCGKLRSQNHLKLMDYAELNKLTRKNQNLQDQRFL